MSPCLGSGSTCESHDNTFTCYCSTGRTGKFCEKLVDQADLAVASFTGRSLVTLRSPPSPGPAGSLALSVRPAKLRDCDLVTTEQFSLSLESGYVVLKSDGRLILRTPRPLTEGRWQELLLKTYRGDARLSVEGEAVQGEGLAAGGWQELEVGRGWRGCVKGLVVGHQPLSLVSRGEPFLLHREGLEECRCAGGCGEEQEEDMQGDQGDQGEEGEELRVRYRGELRTLKASKGEVLLDVLQPQAQASLQSQL